METLNGHHHPEEECVSPQRVLEGMAAKQGLNTLDQAFAKHMDQRDPLRGMRNRFFFPRMSDLHGVEKMQKKSLMNGHGGKERVEDEEDEEDEDEDEKCVYLSGNSLGLQPKGTKERVVEVLHNWARLGVQTHSRGSLPAIFCDTYGREEMGRLVGAAPSQILLMNGLTVNLHLLLLDFYQPTPSRYKILIEGHAFPSDRLLREEGHSIAVVCLSGVQYYTGQKFDMGRITAAAQKEGCIVGWDLAHAVGNVELKLDEWGADFACWCTYKYLNSGPGSIAGAYINARHNKRSGPRLEGWWGNKTSTRFQMREECDRAPSIEGYSISNPPPLLVATVLASLKLFDEAGMERLLHKQRLLTGYLELLIKYHFGRGDSGRPSVTVITPEDPEERGCQLSLIFSFPLSKVYQELTKRGVVCDYRQPNVIRLAPVPLYNSFWDVYRFVTILRHVFDLCKTEAA